MVSEGHHNYVIMVWQGCRANDTITIVTVFGKTTATHSARFTKAAYCICACAVTFCRVKLLICFRLDEPKGLVCKEEK